MHLPRHTLGFQWAALIIAIIGGASTMLILRTIDSLDAQYSDMVYAVD